MSEPLTPETPAISGRPFVIVATQRTGSTLLVRSLDASQQVFCAGEIFRAGPRVHHPEYRFPETLMGSRSLARLELGFIQKVRVKRHLKWLFSTAGAGVRAVGFKLMISQLGRFRSLMPTLVGLGATRFFLCRQDSFATALSYFKAKASGVYHSDRATRRAEQLKISADIGEFHALLDKCESHKGEIYALHAKYGGHLLAYEELVSDWDGVISSIGQDLGISDFRVPAMLDRLSAMPTDVLVENEPDLRRRFGARDVA
jgi:LPS sulfotransferase NodH